MDHDLWGVIFGAVGAVSGLGALAYAHAAFRGGRKTEKLATDANDLAGGSNKIALDARRIAIEANEYSHRAEQRETELHDVRWEGDWNKPGVYVLTKRGDAPAHQVKATVTYDGVELRQTSDLIAGDGDGLEFNFPTAASDFDEEVAERWRRWKRLNSGLPEWMPSMPDLNAPAYIYHSITERVEWVTPRGTPKLHTDTQPLDSFDRFYPD